MAIGLLLRQAREQAGLSAAQISERTRIQRYKIEALENGNYYLLPDGVYLDGIVRAYAREVALEPEPLIERLHRERPPFTLDSVAILKDIHASRKRKGRGREPWKHIAIDLPEQPIRRQPARRQPARRGHRSGSLALAIISLLAGMGWGFYLYETAWTPGNSTFAIAQPSAPAEVRPQIDPVAHPETAVTETLVEISATTASERNVSGSWILLTLPERSRYAGLTGARHGYELHLEQDGERVTGWGRKVSENDRSTRSSAPTSMSVAGTIQSERLTLAFSERGPQRAIGKFVLLLEGDTAMRGRFSSTAAHPSGIVEARRLR
jgi:transcriptional regulator with XRE-family HTH domain